MNISKKALLAFACLAVPLALPVLSGCSVDADDDPDTVVTPGGGDTDVNVNPPDVNVTPPSTTTTTTGG